MAPNDALPLEAPLETPPGADQAPTGPICQKCEEPVANAEMSVCPHCGWYASAGIFVEIDKDWEAACSSDAVEQKKPSMLDVWLHLLPGWAWPLIGCFVAMLAGSLAIRLSVQDEALRSSWATHQFVVALFVQVVCHFFANFVMSIDDPNIGALDAIISPTKSWKKMFGKLPQRLWVAAIAIAALGGLLGAKYVIGGVNFDHLWEWNIKAPPKKSLASAIAEAMPEDNSDMTMEEALGSFAEDAAVGGFDPNDKKPKAIPQGPIQRKKIDALILGYFVDRNNAISEFLLATEVNGKLMYAGRVQPDFTPDESARLVERLRQHHTGSPLVSAPEGAQWVSPRFTCRVTYDRRVESGRLQALLWEEMLGEIKLPW